MYRIRRIESKPHLRAAQLLRGRLYVEMGFLTDDEFTAGLDVDEHDAHAAHFGAFDVAGTLIGTIRMIVPRPGLPLPITRHFDVAVHERTSVEVSRFVLESSARGPAPVLGLCRAVCSRVAAERREHMYATLEEPLLRSLIWLGFPFKIIGDTKQVYNTLNYPTCCRLSQVVGQMERRDHERDFPITAPYFRVPFDSETLLSGATFAEPTDAPSYAAARDS